MSSVQELHFVALVPPEPLRTRLQEMRLYFKEQYDSSHALKSPPHITLLSPFRLENGKGQELEKVLSGIADQVYPVEITLRGFDHFGERVIFVDVEESEALKQLQQTLEDTAWRESQIFNYNYDERPYHPHLTLAFKDLTKKNFQEAWEEFKEREFEASFSADRYFLLKHNGQEWEEKAEYRF